MKVIVGVRFVLLTGGGRCQLLHDFPNVADLRHLAGKELPNGADTYTHTRKDVLGGIREEELIKKRPVYDSCLLYSIAISWMLAKCWKARLDYLPSQLPAQSPQYRFP